MNLKRFFPLILFVFVIAIFIAASSDQKIDCEDCDTAEYGWHDGCTVVIVGKNASTDGSTMTTHTCDCSMCDWTWRYVPAADYEPGSTRKIYHISQYQTWPPEEGLKWERIKDDIIDLEIPQVPHTYGYMHGMFGYMNDQQLAIGESTIGCRPEMRNATPSAQIDLSMLTLLAIERCKTAREAIQFMGDITAKHGYGFNDDGEMLAVADPNEVWIFEIMPVGPLWTPKSGKPGSIWCAQRVPDDHVSVCPNESRIGEIDLDSSDFFMASSNAVSYAVDKGYYDPDSGEAFSWKKAYSPSEGSAASSRGTRVRLWRFLDIVAPSQNFSADTPNMELPFSVKPDEKISAKDVMNITRDKFEGTPFDPVRGIQGGPFKNPNYLPRPFELEGETYNTARTIGVNRAEYTTLTQCRDWLPDPVGGLVWICWGAQDTACYMPFYAGVTAIPESFQIGDHWVFDRNSARWAFDYVDFHTLVAYSLAIEDVKMALAKWEDGAIEQIPTIDKLAADMYETDPAKAGQFLTDFCINNANLVVNAWWKLGDDILVKYNHLWLYNIETRRRGQITFPDWWLKELVEYDKLPPQPKQKKRTSSKSGQNISEKTDRL